MFDALKLTFIFAILVVALMRKANLGLAMAGCALLLGVLFGMDLPAFWLAFARTSTTSANIDLLVALGLIMALEHLLGQEGVLQRMVNALRGLVGDSRVVMATLPALVGLIPSAGGAIFSAPMVEEVSRGSNASPETKTFINYWFRHMAEYVLPIYPAMLLSAQVYGVEVSRLVLLMLPMPLLVFLFGWPMAFHGLQTEARSTSDTQARQHLYDLALGLGPILLILVLVMVLELNIAVSVGLVLIAVLVLFRYSPARALNLLRHAISIKVLLVIFAVLFFKDVLVMSGAVKAFAPVLATAGIPLASVFVLLPLLVGMLTGSPQAIVGTSGPILLGLSGAVAITPAMVSIAMVSGYAGAMMSPAHLCFVLTTGYFKANFARVYRMVMLPELALLAVSVAYLSLL